MSILAYSLAVIAQLFSLWLAVGAGGAIRDGNREYAQIGCYGALLSAGAAACLYILAGDI
ncbi:hypothetical protein BOO69_09565 [Sulfitobacter alexandrii]|uniref:Uncharacterized protein n=1 Tax=Sulfitobacter alexandrii TaxID=1917485 RepID=A0A1J0WH55_9RHOB|nr:hypothetical protein [Sulfitobacter alexandrii]APE43634.1 hypothetical protein BOO69_09565 [Sulfitobacter alexandrii]